MTEEKTPKQIVELLDKYIIGQSEAKKSVAVALYNRYRRLQLPKQMQQDITPKNMLMAGPTGVGKTEIARRLAKIVDAPFVKVEATKFTEVGYVGRDVESMVRDLVEEAVRMEENDQFEHVKMQTGGYGVAWDVNMSISDSMLYRMGKIVPLTAADFRNFVTHRVINATEAAQMLGCSRQNIIDLTKRGKLHPLKTSEKNTLYLKSEILKRNWQ